MNTKKDDTLVGKARQVGEDAAKKITSGHLSDCVFREISLICVRAALYVKVHSSERDHKTLREILESFNIPDDMVARVLDANPDDGIT